MILARARGEWGIYARTGKRALDSAYDKDDGRRIVEATDCPASEMFCSGIVRNVHMDLDDERPVLNQLLCLAELRKTLEFRTLVVAVLMEIGMAETVARLTSQSASLHHTKISR